MKPSKTKDPFFGLKYIAYCRTGLPVNEDDIDEETVVNFAKWQICKVRNVLWNDPIWESYTPQEILIEFFAIKFDEDENQRKEFEAGLVSVREDDLEWLERMESKYRQETNNPEKPDSSLTDEFEDKF